jgi:hypothetical protein
MYFLSDQDVSDACEAAKKGWPEMQIFLKNFVQVVHEKAQKESTNKRCIYHTHSCELDKE